MRHGVKTNNRSETHNETANFGHFTGEWKEKFGAIKVNIKAA